MEKLAPNWKSVSRIVCFLEAELSCGFFAVKWMVVFGFGFLVGFFIWFVFSFYMGIHSKVELSKINKKKLIC